MSGTASRYIAGVPYGPGRAVGRYPNAASVLTDLPSVSVPGVELVGGNQGGGVVPQVVEAADVGAGGMGLGGNLLSMVLSGAGLIDPALRLYDRLTGPGAEETLPLPPEFVTEEEALRRAGGAEATAIPGLGANATALVGRGGYTATDLAMAQALDQAGLTAGPATSWIGDGGSWTGAFEPGALQVNQAGTMNLLDAPLEGGTSGLGEAAAAGGGGLFSGVGDWVRGFQTNLAAQNAAMPGAALSQDMGLTGSLGEHPLFGGDLATGLASAGGSLLGGWISAQNPWTQQGYGGVGQQAGSALGGIGAGALIGSALGPVGALFGGLAGSFIGGTAGAGIGSQIGPSPSIGRNFSAFGTFGDDGALSWGGFGGDNGGTAADAQNTINWFTNTLGGLADQYGYAFNPNAAGQQIRIGGYDQWDRNFTDGGVGGLFYDAAAPGAAFGGAPERYALRPQSSWWAGADPTGALQIGSPDGWVPWEDGSAFNQAGTNAFAQNVFADMVARNVFTQGGEALDVNNSPAPYGWYSLGGDFNSALAQRQNAQTAWQAHGQALAAQEQANQQAAANWAQTYGSPDFMVPGAGGGLTSNIYSPGAE